MLEKLIKFQSTKLGYYQQLPPWVTPSIVPSVILLNKLFSTFHAALNLKTVGESAIATHLFYIGYNFLKPIKNFILIKLKLKLTLC